MLALSDPPFANLVAAPNKALKRHRNRLSWLVSGMPALSGVIETANSVEVTLIRLERC